MCSSTYVYVSLYAFGDQEFIHKLSLQEPTNLSFELVSYWDLNPLICLDGQASKPRGSSCLCLSSGESASAHHHA